MIIPLFPYRLLLCHHYGCQIIYVGRYYWPRLQSQVIWYAICSLIIGILAVLASHYDFKGSYMLLSCVLGLMMIFAPLAFARYNSRAIDITVPASWQAKSIFMIAYSAIIIPVVTMFLPVLCELLYPGEINMKVLMVSMNVFGGDVPRWMDMLMSSRLNMYMNGAIPALFTLFFVVMFKHNIVIKTIVWDVVIGAVVYISIMVYTVVYLVQHLTAYFGEEMADVDPSEIEAYSNAVVHEMTIPLLAGTCVGYMAAFVVMIILVVMKIKNRQI